jgi:hypothetical protein
MTAVGGARRHDEIGGHLLRFAAKVVASTRTGWRVAIDLFAVVLDERGLAVHRCGSADDRRRSAASLVA